LISTSPSPRVEFLREELKVRQLNCASLVERFERQTLTGEQRSDLLDRWEVMLKESQLLQATLDLLEKQETEAALIGMSAEAKPGQS
jgi:hypothetical protein